MTEHILLKEYYKIQCDRMKHHEDRRIQFSNIVVVISSGIITLGAKLDTPQGVYISILLTVLLIVINLNAIWFINESHKWFGFHKKRANSIIELYNSKVSDDNFKLSDNKLIPGIERPNTPDGRGSLKNLQKNLHKSLIVIAIFYPLTIHIITH